MTMLRKTIIPVIDMTPVSIFSSPKLVLKRWQKTLYVRNEPTQKRDLQYLEGGGIQESRKQPRVNGATS